jgi:hypothetical protein
LKSVESKITSLNKQIEEQKKNIDKADELYINNQIKSEIQDGVVGNIKIEYEYL